MSGRFVLVSLVPPPEGRTIMVRDGGSVFDAAFSKWTGWHALIPGGREVDLPRAPREWWLSDRLAAELNITIPPHTESTIPQPQIGPKQGILDFSGKSDSGKLSERATGRT
jgi:hypothetical protein